MVKSLCLVVLVLAAGLAAEGAAFAQAIPNPGHIEYVVSPDHGTLSKYVVGFFLTGATDPVQSADLPIVAPAADQKVTQPISATPLGYGTYVAKMRAVAGTVAGEWSAASNEFARSPFPPTSAPTVKK